MFNKNINIRKKRIFMFFFSFLLAILVALGTYFSGQTSVAFADVGDGIDESYVMDDLEGLIIGGEEFNVENYPFDKERETEILTFIEYGYSTKAEFKNIYGLYVYVYNPQGLTFQHTSALNEITLSFGDSGTSPYKSYRLEGVNWCLNPDRFNLFCKFRVSFTPEQLKEVRRIFTSLESGKRTYSIGEVELLEAGKYSPTSFKSGQVFTYSGFGKGLDDTSVNASTLSCLYGQAEVISPKVGLTSYTLPGSNGESAYCHDMIFTAYFSVPNELLKKYGSMYSMSGEYLDARLKPALVTGESWVNEAINPFLGIELTENRHPTDPEGKNFYLDGLHFNYSSTDNSGGLFSCGGYNYNGEVVPDSLSINFNDYLSTVPWCDPLYLLFHDSSITKDNLYKSYVSSERLQEFMLSTKGRKNYSQELVFGKYSKDIFSYIADEKSEFRVSVDKELDLTNIQISPGFLYALTGGYKSIDKSFEYDGLLAVKEVGADDFTGKIESEICDSLLISPSDYDEFKRAYDKAIIEEETMFLFRYRVAPYISVNANCYLFNKLGTGSTVASKNHYFFETYVSLNFDVIDVSFVKDGVETFIPVAVSPMDHIPTATGPTEIKDLYDTDGVVNWLKVILIILLSAVVVWILNKIGLLPYVMKGIYYIITWPYYLIKWISGGGSGKKRYKKKRR